jgi:hypothetical protein
METKQASNRQLDRADVVQVMKKTAFPTLRKVRNQITKVYRTSARQFDELHEAAELEMEQERERGGLR